MKTPCPVCGYDIVNIPQKTAARDLKLAREKKGIMEKVVAKRMGITPAYVSMLEAGKRHLTHELIHKFQSALGK